MVEILVLPIATVVKLRIGIKQIIRPRGSQEKGGTFLRDFIIGSSWNSLQE